MAPRQAALDGEGLRRRLERHATAQQDFRVIDDSAAGKAELEASLAEHLKTVNATLEPREQLDCLVITYEACSAENDLITPTFKVRRNKIEDRFAARYEQWKAARSNVIWHAG